MPGIDEDVEEYNIVESNLSLSNNCFSPVMLGHICLQGDIPKKKLIITLLWIAKTQNNLSVHLKKRKRWLQYIHIVESYPRIKMNES